MGSCLFPLAVLANIALAIADDRVMRLEPGEAREVQLAAGQKLQVSVALEGGQAAAFSVQQLDAMLHVTWHSSDDSRSPLLKTQAGRMARLPIRFVADQARLWDIEIGASRPDRSASLRVALGPDHAISGSDRKAALAEGYFAQAETIRLAAGGVETGRRSGDVDAARRLYAQAVDAWRDAEFPCGVLIAQVGLARLELQQSHYPESQSAARAALEGRCTDATDPAIAADRAAALRTLAAAQGYQGDFEASALNGESARKLYQRTGDRRFEGVILGNLSAVYRELGQTRHALDSSKASLQIAESTGDIEGIAFSRESMANAYLARGELAPALATYRKTLEDLNSHAYPMVEGLVWNELGSLYQRLGENDQARSAWAQAREVWSATGNRSGMAETWINEGEAALEDGLAAAATAAFLRALEIARADHLQNPELNALRGLGRAMAASGRSDEARKQLQTSLEQARSIGATAAEAAGELALGDLDSTGKDWALAQPHYARSLELARKMADLGTEAVARASLARAAAGAGRWDRAREEIELALSLVETQHAGIADPALRTGYFASRRAYYDLYIDVLMAMHARDPAKGLAVRALEIAEWARARSLQELLAERRIGPEADIAPGLQEAELAAQDRLRMLAWRLARLKEDAQPAERSRNEREIERVRRDLDAVRGRIHEANPRYAELAHPKPAGLGEIRAQLLDTETRVLEYWLGDDHSYLWVITRDSVQTHVLPSRASIEAAANQMREAILARAAPVTTVSIEQLVARETEDAMALQGLARVLSRQVLPAEVQLPKADRLVVVTDGALHAIPFNLLVAEREGATDSELRELVYLPSLRTLRGLRELPKARRDGPIALFADPVLAEGDSRLNDVPTDQKANNDSTLAAAIGQSGIGTLQRLAYTHAEVAAIAARAGSREARIIEGFDLTRESVLAADWSTQSILHFATHSLINTRLPELSGIVLSLVDQNNKPVDGFLRINDIYRLRLRADLVVLSVCDSGNGRSIGSEGPATLARAFFYAGAPRVLATLWPVDDRASASFMRRFYAGILEHGLRPPQALRQAQMELRNDPRWSAAYYWSGFVLQGDWR